MKPNPILRSCYCKQYIGGTLLLYIISSRNKQNLIHQLLVHHLSEAAHTMTLLRRLFKSKLVTQTGISEMWASRLRSLKILETLQRVPLSLIRVGQPEQLPQALTKGTHKKQCCCSVQMHNHAERGGSWKLLLPLCHSWSGHPDSVTPLVYLVELKYHSSQK